jgi:hypothetical protein
MRCPMRASEVMTTGELVFELRGVANHILAAAIALQEGDLTNFKIEYAQALRALDSFQDGKSSASL